MTPSTDWAERFPKIHYEPEHERGQTCWCKPATLVKEGVPHIEHNEQRVILKAFIAAELEKERASARQEGRDEREKEIMTALEAVWSDEAKARKGGDHKHVWRLMRLYKGNPR